MSNRVWQNVPSSLFKTGRFDGLNTVAEVVAEGSFGVGEFERLDGEITFLDGRAYRATADGQVRPAHDSDLLCFAMVCQFRPQWSGPVPPGLDFAGFQSWLDSKLAAPTAFYALAVRGSFESVTAIAMPGQQKPYPTFSEALESRREFKSANIQGTLLGFYNPAYVADVGIPGYHFHLLSDDHARAGHVTEFQLAQTTLSAERINTYTLSLEAGEEIISQD